MAEALKAPAPFRKAETLKCGSCGHDILGVDILLAGTPPRCGNCKPSLLKK